MQSILSDLAALTHAVSTSDSAISEQAKLCLVDVAGCIVAGQAVESTRRMRSAFASPTVDGVPLLGTAERAQPEQAAIINGYAGHVLDLDDGCYAGQVHGSVVIFPAVLSCLSRVQLDGRQFMDAFSAGWEVECAFGRLVDKELYDAGWWNTAVLGSLGAAAACARALGLSETTTQAALAIALANAFGVKGVFGTDIKPLQAGLAARAGYEAAIAARAGLTAPMDIVDHKAGFAAPRGLAAPIVAGGRIVSPRSVFIEPGITFKRWPLCTAAYAAMEATRQIMAEHGLVHRDIAAIDVEADLLVRNCLIHDIPATVSECQFSLPFAVAVTAVRSDLAVSDLDRATLQDAEIRRVMATVSLRVVDAFAGEGASGLDRESASVTVTDRQGRAFRLTVLNRDARAFAAMSPDEIGRKFLANTRSLLGADASELALAGMMEMGRETRALDMFQRLMLQS